MIKLFPAITINLSEEVIQMVGTYASSSTSAVPRNAGNKEYFDVDHFWDFRNHFHLSHFQGPPKGRILP